jgi:hypothetical protein
MTDAEVLAQLKLRRIRLRIELDRVDKAILAFETIDHIEPLDILAYSVEDMEVTEEFATDILMYNPAWSVQRKIEYALVKLGKADARSLTEYLVRVDGHIKDSNMFHNRITYEASRLYKLNRIKAERQGKKNYYSLFPKEVIGREPINL